MSGQWTQDIELHVDVTLGVVTIHVPADVGVRVTLDKTFASFDHEGLDRARRRLGLAQLGLGAAQAARDRRRRSSASSRSTGRAGKPQPRARTPFALCTRHTLGSGAWWCWGIESRSLVKKTLKETLDDNLLGLAAQTAYYFFFSLFPLLLFVAPLLSLVGNKQETFGLFASQLQQVVPSEGWALIGGVIKDVVYAKNAPGLMSIGALLAIWAGSNVFGALIDALNAAYDVKDTRPWWKKKLIAVASVIVIGFVDPRPRRSLILGGDRITDWLAGSTRARARARARW